MAVAPLLGPVSRPGRTELELGGNHRAGGGAEARLHDLRIGKARTHTLEDVERDLGLAD